MFLILIIQKLQAELPGIKGSIVKSEGSYKKMLTAFEAIKISFKNLKLYPMPLT